MANHQTFIGFDRSNQTTLLCIKFWHLPIELTNILSCGTSLLVSFVNKNSVACILSNE